MHCLRSLVPPVRALRLGTLFLLLAALPVARGFAAESGTGQQIYQKQCASCHGANGEGTKEHYKKPLAGTRSIPQLASLIAKTMPKEDPGTCVGADAEKVAAYMYDAFYSTAARDRNQPPRIELSRLTVRQYQNAVADLLASFRTPGRWDDKHGLRGEYFDARGFQQDKRKIDRVDPEVRFDFGTAGPSDSFNASQFSLRWSGSVLAPETGLYEFVVRTEHATRLWVNDARKPLLDAWVKSGTDTEFRTTIFLVAGRAYPLKLEFSKAKQGVDDSKKNPQPPAVKSSMTLLWKPPQQTLDVIPARYLTPNNFPETCVVETPFPPDDRSLGWEKANTVSKAWDQAATDAALETAAYVTAHFSELTGVREDAKDREVKARDFCRRFAERAFRRPLTDEQKRLYVDHQFEAAKDTDKAIQRVVLFVLKSPRFLYRELNGSVDAYDVAARLSFSLWDSLPDDELLKAAAEGKLAQREQVERQAERLLADPRARVKLQAFFLQWLKVNQAPEIAKDPMRYPGFDVAVVGDLRTSLELFLADVLSSPEADFRRLLLGEELYLNGRLAKLYGADLPADAPFQKVSLNAEQRAGVLTHPYLMSTFAYTSTSSPIHRGVFLTRGVLGVSLRPPQEAFIPLPEELHPKLTTRDRVALQTKSTACQACHSIINPLGFSLENFDAIGRYREQENGLPVDAKGSYLTRTGEKKEFNGARELAKFLAGSGEVQSAFADQLFQHLVKQPVRAYGPQRSKQLRIFFGSHDFNIRKLVVDIAATTALTGRDAKPPTKPVAEATRPPGS